MQGSSEGYRLRGLSSGICKQQRLEHVPQCSLPTVLHSAQPGPQLLCPGSPQEQPALLKEAPRTLNSSLPQGLGLPGETPLVLALIWM